MKRMFLVDWTGKRNIFSLYHEAFWKGKVEKVIMPRTVYHKELKDDDHRTLDQLAETYGIEGAV